MGNVTPTVTDILHREEANLSRFRRALRREDQVVLDDLFVAAYKHRAAAGYAGHLLPFETFLLAMQIEDHKEVMNLRREVENLRGQVQKLLSDSTSACPPGRKQRVSPQPEYGDSSPLQGPE